MILLFIILLVLVLLSLLKPLLLLSPILLLQSTIPLASTQAMVIMLITIKTNKNTYIYIYKNINVRFIETIFRMK